MSYLLSVRVWLLLLLVMPVGAAAQESCGDIISINPYSGDTQQESIEDCADPFDVTQAVPNDLDLYIDDVEVESGASEVGIPGEFFQSIKYNYDRYQRYFLQVYEQSGDDLVQIDVRPPMIEDLSEAQKVAIIDEYYADDPDIEVYRQAIISNDIRDLNEEQSRSYSNFEFAVLPQVLQERYAPQIPVGTYWLVFTEEVLCQLSAVDKRSWLANLWGQIVPTAHAQIQDRCAPGYIPKRFVVKLTVAQTDEIIEEEPAGASSVLFLPGIQASRLYAGEDIVLPGLPNNVERGDKLWEQTNDKRIALLAMDEAGQSVYDIYTQDVVEEVTGLAAGANIYKGFLQLLEDLKTDVDSDTGTTTIVDYQPFAYDWRYSVFDVATQPVQYENEAKLLKDEVIRLADASHTGKVTIVAHSNGGLVAKALLHEYGDNELQDKVDKVVMIGTPQLGTPKGISALLYGQVMEGIGNFFTKDAVLRDTIRNMPGTYTLLPSRRYINEVAEEPLITVPDGYPLSVYNGVVSRPELDSFLLDTQGVVAAANPTIYEPIKLNNDLLRSALSEQAILDAWRPPAGVEVYEVAGTGIPTPKALHYKVVPVITCSNTAAVFVGSQCEVTMGLKPKLQVTVQGDKTVVLGSARGQLGDKRTLTVDLKRADDLLLGNRNHGNLTEVPVIQAFVDSVISYPYVTNDIITPEFSVLLSGYTVHAGHSPVTLRINTPDGQITGIVDGEIREDIAGTQFITLGGSTYVIVPDEVTDYQLEVIGTGNGVYTLETSTLSPEDVQTVIASFTASTTDTMLATMEVTDGEMGDLQTDFDGDGAVDEVRTSTGELVVSEVVEVVVEPTQTAGSPAFATRVGDRSPVPEVLGASVSVESLTTEQYAQLQRLLADIQHMLDQAELNPDQLVVVSEVLSDALLIIEN